MDGSPRFHDLDALRALTMWLGIVLHGAMFLIYTPDFAEMSWWPVKDEWAYSIDPFGNLYAYLVVGIHGFRMPVFFMLSGFFCAMLWQRHGLWFLARHRLKRIGLPLLVCALTIIPINNWLFNGGDYRSAFMWSSQAYSLYHLWFLQFLLLMTCAFLLAAGPAGLRFRSPLWWLLIPLTCLPQYFTEAYLGADTALELVPRLHVFGYYLIFFTFGAFFYQRSIAIQPWWIACLLVALLLVAPVNRFLVLNELLPVPWQQAAQAVLAASYSWLMCFGLLGLFRRIAARKRAWVSYASDSSYWFYLWHFPLVVVAQFLVVGWPISVHLKFILILVGVTAILLCTYQLGVRYTLIGAILNGKRRRPLPSTPYRRGGYNPERS